MVICCEISHIKNVSDFSNFRLSKSGEFISETFGITKDTKEYYNELLHKYVVVLKRREHGTKYIRIVMSISNVTSVNFSRNYICNINLKKLEPIITNLNLSHNILTKLSIFPDNLLHINVNHNYIKQLPILPPTLRTLKASHCNLSTIPPLPNTLECLSIKNNNLTQLPENFLQCNNLINLKY